MLLFWWSKQIKGNRKKNLEKAKQKNPLSHVGGINAHASVGESKVHEGGDGINLVAVGCAMMKRKLYLNFHYRLESQFPDHENRK